MEKNMIARINQIVEANRKRFSDMSDAIWEYAELAFEEKKSSKLQMEFLEKEGFEITPCAAGLETAFVAQYGSGKPVIGLVGEFDALSELSQQSGLAEKKPLVEGAPGHGCGHHLLGTGVIEAACALKQILDEDRLPGTIRYYGCPAEEGGGGKVYLVQAGLFSDVDVALSWHPNPYYDIMENHCVTMVNYQFHGITSHAGSTPHLGRSALDAAELMHVGTQFLQEHKPPHATLQCSFVNAGNPACNIVPDFSEVAYGIRTTSVEDMLDLFERVKNIAQGAALMTGTQVSEPIIKSSYCNILRNDTLADLLRANAEQFGPLAYTREELETGAAFQAKCPHPPYPKVFDDARLEYVLCGSGSDFGDISQVVPGIAFEVPTFVYGSPMHHWLAVAQGKESYAHKGMDLAAKLLAACTIDLLTREDLVQAVKEEFSTRMAGKEYRSLMDATQPPK